jgi:hypothetical protein
MIPSVSLLALAAATWFGPVQVSFDTSVEGNPYDYRANDVRVVFTAADGRREERLAYYDEGQWRAWLTVGEPGAYRATLVRNGTPVDAPAQEVTLAESVRLRDGFVRVEGTRFALDSGAAFFPLGHNLAWRNEGEPALPERLQRMAAAGMNWTRVWACAWDGKNPFFNRGQPYPRAGELLPEPMRQWDGIVAAAEASGVRLQFVLFHHGLFSTRNDSNWAEHPWNRANGGFLDRPQQFFTDPTAKEYAKRWLRYAVARWGHSPAIMAWELFNEVEWTDAATVDNDWPTIAGWHAEMAAFVRGIDPYRHLVTTSAAREHPEIYAALDYFQPHTYPRDVFNGIAGVRPQPGKPWFFGEFGRGTWEQGPEENLTVREGIWAGILSGHAGAAQYWFWDRVLAQGLEPEFTRAARALELSRLAARSAARSVAVEVRGAPRAALAVSPGRGWSRTERVRFELPADATAEKLSELSVCLNPRDSANPAGAREPLEFVFTLSGAGEAEVVLTSISDKGAGLSIAVDGCEVVRQQWPATLDAVAAPTGGRRHQAAPPPIKVPLVAGAHVLRIENIGPDWVQLDRAVFPEIGCAVRAHAIGEAEFALVRLQAAEAGLGSPVDLHIDGLADGTYRLQTLDLTTGAESERAAEVVGGSLRDFEIAARDVALVVAR